jgi:hypothetical protein
MKYCLFVLSVLVAFASCKKVETPLSKQEKLRAISWRIDSTYIVYLSAKGDDSASRGTWPEQFIDGNYVYPRPDCLFDDYFKFQTNNTGTHVTGPNKCGVSETDNIDFTWGIYQADTKMYIYGMYAIFGQDVNADLTSFEDEKFTITYTKKVGATGSINARVTYKFKKK